MFCTLEACRLPQGLALFSLRAIPPPSLASSTIRRENAELPERLDDLIWVREGEPTMIHPAGIAYAATANKGLPGARSAHGVRLPQASMFDGVGCATRDWRR
jgi:hypothetical protein